MSSSIPFKQYIGPTLIAQTLDSHGYRPYLQRNIRQIMKGHETELENFRPKQAGQPQSVPETRHQSFSKMPDRETMATAVQQSRPPCLKVQFRSFQKLNVDYTSDEETKSPDPDWLPSPGKFLVTCYVQSSTSAASQQLLIDECRLGSLVRKRDKNGQTRFAFDLDEPVYIHSKMLTAGAEAIKFSVKFNHVGDAEEVDCELSRGKRSHKPPSEIRATWKDIGECPPDGQLIKCSVIRNGVQQLVPGWGFLINMDWSEPCASALEIFNQTLSEGMPSQSPDAFARTSTGTVGKQQRYRITYVFAGNALQSRSIVRESLACIYCDSRSPHPSFDSLHLHYLGHHDHFSFTTNDGKEQTKNIVEKTIHVDYITETQQERASFHNPDNRTINWIRPDEPFDADSYLNEDDRSWISHRPAERLRLNGPRPPRRLKLIGPRLRGLRSTSPERMAYEQHDQPTKPEDVPELPVKRRRTYRVPEIPGVVIFRTNSKRAVQTGEWLAESDAENQDDWLDSRRTRNKAFLPSRDSLLQFEILYDAHMKVEEPLADIYFPRTIIRFCRKHAIRLAQPDMLAALETRLADLVIYRKINEKIKSDCLDVLQKIQRKEEIMTETAEISGCTSSIIMGPPLTTNLHQPPSTRNPLCVCGKPCTTARGIIYCSNPSCSRNDFHMQCVGLARRVPGWRCPDCRAVTSTPVAPMAIM